MSKAMETQSGLAEHRGITGHQISTLRIQENAKMRPGDPTRDYLNVPWMRILFNLSVVVLVVGIVLLAITTSARKLKPEVEQHQEHFFGEEIMERGQGGVSAQSEWPGATGRSVDEVVEEIEAASGSSLTVVKVPEGAMVTMDFKPKRVRVYYKDGVVVGTPKIG